MSSRALGNDFAHLQQDNAEIERSMLAQEVEALRTRLGLRQVDVSKECGVNASMLSQWMLGRYKGNIARINGLMEGWLVSRRGGKPLDKTNMAQHAHSSRLSNSDGMDHLQRQQLKRKPAVQMDQYPLYKYPKSMDASDASLIPIRLDVDVDGYRYIDAFLLSTNESDYTYETLSSSLIKDLDLPDCFYAPIIESIKAQVAAATKYAPWSSAVKSEALYRIYIKLRINDTILLDTFEWDLHNPTNDPEQFARVFCSEMGLCGEFELAIAMSIRDQLQQYAKGHLEQQKDQASRLPPVAQPLRDMDDAKLWEPKIRYVLADDVPVLEREDFKRMRPTSMPAPQPMLPYFPVKPMSYFNNATPSSVMAAKPNRPPKPVNTFLIFCRQWRKKLMAQNPAASAKEASKLLGDMWQKLTEAQRASYQPLADKENAQRMLEWKRKEGDKVPAGDFSAAVSQAGTATPHVPAAFAGTPVSSAGTAAASASPSDALDELEGENDLDDDDENDEDEEDVDDEDDDDDE